MSAADAPNSFSLGFAPRASDDFSQVLQKRVSQYFESRKIGSHANLFMVLKTLFFLGGFAAMNVLILKGALHSTAAVWAIYACMGFFAAGIGFNVGHDALHGAYSSNRLVNEWVGHSYSLIGAHEYNWKVLHNIIHHSYTNIAGADGDLHPVPFLRFYISDEGLKPYHRFQHFYAPFLYALTSLIWVVKKDFDHIVKKRHLIYNKPETPKSEYAELVGVKILYFSFFLGLPIWLSPYHWPVIVGGLLMMHVVQGMMLSLVFQLGHIVEGPTVHNLSEGQNLLPAWHRVQLEGTCNFAPDSWMANFICGGLNHQIEHHLFPQICHIHYPALSHIVRQTAREHGLTYHEKPTFWAALKSHFVILKKAGRKSEEANAAKLELILSRQ